MLQTAKCFEIKLYTADRLPRVLAVKCSKKLPFKLGRMYQTAHQNDGFNALRLCSVQQTQACLLVL